MATHHSGPLRLDPFAFPSETKGRFRMLLLTAFAMAWSLGSYFIDVPNFYTLNSRISAEERTFAEKFRSQWSLRDITPEEIRAITESQVVKETVLGVVYQTLRIPLVLSLLFFVFAGTAFFYVRHGRYLRRRYRTRKLDTESSAKAMADLHRLAETTGLTQEVQLEWKPGSFDGLAFGLQDREVIALSGHPKLLQQSWDAVTRAVALHELGHVANDDVRNREISRALWKTLAIVLVFLAFCFAVLSLVIGELRVPILGAGLFTGNIATPREAFFISLVRTATIFLVMAWIWAELIRTREFFADWRVAAWGEGDALLRRLQLPASLTPPWRRWRVSRALRRRWRERGFWWRLEAGLCWLWVRGWRHHPSNARRIEILKDPAPLFRATIQLAFVTGLLSTALLGQLGPVSKDLLFWASFIVVPLWMLAGPAALVLYVVVVMSVAVLLTYLIAGALGVQVQREAIFDLATGKHTDWGYLRLAKPALLFALGVEVGLLLTPWATLPHRAPLGSLAWICGFTGLIWIWLIYFRAMARFWLGSRASVAPPNRSQKAFTWVGTFLLAILLWPALMTRIAIHVAADPALLTALTPPTESARAFFINIIVLGSIILFCIALVLYLVVGATSLLVAGARVVFKRPRCTSCGERATPGFVVGRRCSGCGKPLARWAYLDSIGG